MFVFCCVIISAISILSSSHGRFIDASKGALTLRSGAVMAASSRLSRVQGEVALMPTDVEPWLARSYGEVTKMTKNHLAKVLQLRQIQIQRKGSMASMVELKAQGLVPISIEEQRKFGETEFPYVLTAEQQVHDVNSVVDLIKSNKDEILKVLLKHGAVLFRGLPVQSPEDFNQFALAFGWEDLPYVGGAAVRTNVTGVVFTSNEAPPDKLIPFHHEMAQVENFPKHLFFYCDVEPSEGGETPICLSNKAYEAIKAERPEFVKKLEEKGVVYTRVLPNGDDPSSPIGRGWQSTFLTEDKKEAEKRCTEQGTHFEWLADGCMKTVTKIIPGVRLDERTGLKTWFNSIVAAYDGWRDSRNTPEKAVTFGDGTFFDPDDIAVARRILQEKQIAFKWRKGDVVLIDNRLVLHSRNSFKPPRRILAALFR